MGHSQTNSHPVTTEVLCNCLWHWKCPRDY